MVPVFYLFSPVVGISPSPTADWSSSYPAAGTRCGSGPNYPPNAALHVLDSLHPKVQGPDVLIWGSTRFDNKLHVMAWWVAQWISDSVWAQTLELNLWCDAAQVFAWAEYLQLTLCTKATLNAWSCWWSGAVPVQALLIHKVFYPPWDSNILFDVWKENVLRPFPLHQPCSPWPLQSTQWLHESLLTRQKLSLLAETNAKRSIFYWSFLVLFHISRYSRPSLLVIRLLQTRSLAVCGRTAHNIIQQQNCTGHMMVNCNTTHVTGTVLDIYCTVKR